ncbi:helix-turn-helix domain-containing protein [Streptomyces sp. NPDC018972]|uniref:helix-turn-helix domain-containing protein n=1 Tax=Streptomyces sp. NPDC018972 TaxID=3365060 RepID=UPI00378D2754
MVVSEGVNPADARTAHEYVALLRELKKRSGLTYRQLEQRAAERDEVLARSTLADVLRRDALPRAEVVAALVRACGAGRDVPEWLAARERLAAGEVPEAEGTAPEPESPGRPPEPAGTGRGRTALTATVASLGTVALLVVGATVLFEQDDGKPTGGAAHGEATTNPTVAPGPAAGFSRVRPARAPELCLTDGNVRGDGTDESKLVAVERPCAEAVPPRVYLQRADDGLYQIQFHHPVHGPGCLTVLGDGAFKGTLEPWKDCRAGGDSQWFRIERADGTDGWRLRSAQDDALCVGIRGGAGEAGAAAVMERCAERGGDDQVFLIGRE